MTSDRPVFPMSALVGLDDLVLALVLAAIDPAIGGVLLRGDKGSAKTTAARALASLLAPGSPFVELPLGATEDRVVGSVDVAAMLGEGHHRFQAGLLQAAHGGVLYVDEVNLLADHLVDVLLDAAATGVNRVEREGVSHTHPARFVLVGSMNPEEGELRPQLLDRFGLSVQVSAPLEPAARAEAVRRRLAFDEDPAAFVARWAAEEAELAHRVRSARPAPLEDGLADQVAALCVEAGAEGLRADIVICRAAAALAGWRDQPAAGAAEVAAVAPLALAHRRRTPFSPPPPEPGRGADRRGRGRGEGPGPGTEGSAPDAGPGTEGSAPDAGPGTEGSAPGAGRGEPEGGAGPERDPAPPSEQAPLEVGALLEGARRGASAAAGRRRAPGAAATERGRTIGSAPLGPGAVGPVSPRATVLAAAARPGRSRPLRIEAADLRTPTRERRGQRVVVVAVDTSGSMGAAERVAAARGAVLSLLADAYQRRDRVAVVVYRDRSAEVLLRPTSSTEVALARLAQVPTGGRTPLAAGIETTRELALEERRKGAEPLVVFVTDGRATWAAEGDPFETALAAARGLAGSRLDALVVDCEAGERPLRLGRQLAEAMKGRYVRVLEEAVGAPAAGLALAEAIGAAL